MRDEFVRAFILGRVIDGDTIVAAGIDLGFHMWLHSSPHFEVQFRLLRVNSPESNRPASRAAGLEAKLWTSQWLKLHVEHGGLFARTTKTDSFGRYLAEVSCGQDHNLSDSLLASGNAVPFAG